MDSKKVMSFVRTVCAVFLAVLAGYGLAGVYNTPSVYDRVVPQAVVPQLVNIDDAEGVCADLLGVEGNLVAGWMMQCEVQKWVGDTLVTFKVLGSPLVPPLDDDGVYPPPDPVEPEEDEWTEEDEPCERHRDGGEEESPLEPGEFAI